MQHEPAFETQVRDPPFQLVAVGPRRRRGKSHRDAWRHLGGGADQEVDALDRAEVGDHPHPRGRLGPGSDGSVDVVETIQIDTVLDHEH